MTAAEYSAMLARAVRAGRLTSEQAEQLAGRYARIDPASLPLPPAQALRPLSADDIRRGQRDAGAGGEAVRERLQDRFEDQRAVAAEGLTDGAIRVWHEGFQADLLAYLSGQGLAADPSLDDLRPLAQTADTQLAFLARFAESLAIAALLGALPSAPSIAARSQLYSGAGRALWYVRWEARFNGPGVVIDYISVDDRGTCQPCLDAEASGPYLMGQGPMPGAVCRGRGRCRCDRTSRYDLAAYQRLIGRP